MDLKKNFKLLNPSSLKKTDGKVFKRTSHKTTSKISLSPRTTHKKRSSLESTALITVSDNNERKSSKNISVKSACLYERPRFSQSKIKKISRDNDGSPSVRLKKKFPESLGEAVYEGSLKSKNTFVDGKYSLDRAWKPTYVVLRGHCLCLHPDKNSQNLVVYDHPVSIGSALVDIAYDYVKRSNVFRVMTLGFSEFLFEAPSSADMLGWIQALQKQGLSHNQEYLRKKILSHTSSKKHKTKHVKQDPARTLVQKNTSPTSTNITKQDLLQPSKLIERFRSKSPEGRQLKQQVSPPSIHIEMPSDVKSKSWREKMAERFRRANSHPGTTGFPISFSSSNQQTSLLSPPLLHHHSSFNSYNTDVYQSNVDGDDEEDDDDDAAARKKYKGSLGIPLKYCHIPLIVEVCIEVIESQGLEKKGIYRVPGNNAAISILQAEVDRDPETLSRSHEKWNDINAVVSLLKLFFRKLPEPLVTTSLYQSFIDANHTENKTKRLLKLKRLVHLLPHHNFETFYCLATHLNKVSTYEKSNMMDAHNLAIIFGPTLLQPTKNESMVNMVKDMNDQCQHKWFFGSWDEDVQVPGEDTSNTVPITSMEDQLIEKAQQHCSNFENSSSLGGIKKSSKSSNVTNNNGSQFTATLSSSAAGTIQHSLISKVRKENNDNKGLAVYSVESVYCDFDKSFSSDSSKATLRSRHYSAKSHLKEEPLKSGLKLKCGPTDKRGSTSLRVEHNSRRKSRDESATTLDKTSSTFDNHIDDGSTVIFNKESTDKTRVQKSQFLETSKRSSIGGKVSLVSNKYNIKVKTSDRRPSTTIKSLDSLKKPTLIAKQFNQDYKKLYEGYSGEVESKYNLNPSSMGSFEKLKSVSSSKNTSGRKVENFPLKHGHKRYAGDGNCERNICSSGFLQPPRLNFKSRYSQKSCRKSKLECNSSSKLISKSFSSNSDDVRERSENEKLKSGVSKEYSVDANYDFKNKDDAKDMDDVFIKVKDQNANDLLEDRGLDNRGFDERSMKKPSLIFLSPFHAKQQKKRSTSIDCIVNEIKYFKITQTPTSSSSPLNNRHTKHLTSGHYDDHYDGEVSKQDKKFTRASLKIHSSLHSLLNSPQRLKTFFHRDLKALMSPTHSPMNRRYLSFHKTKCASDSHSKPYYLANESTGKQMSKSEYKKLYRTLSADDSCQKEMSTSCLKEHARNLAYESSV
ncbi:hypothetical protein HELRODRAFT_187947 [Helobdella robusta]|uniref:Rho-GAP domain-containing protein n=1 Tax=Helobdella robusta TaxID=6412 RepID=T1FPH9_HELRO|nr:hypothetical protein HELRODRAFT_187947 [Helobdella robusta]ESO12665.1 hypothetical protein HELRODRAFT_187947 [Helobdella robusta]